MRRRTGMTPNETAFLEHYMESANATEAAIKAGYSAKTAQVMGCKLKRKLETEIRERVGKNFGGYSAEAAKIIRDLASNSSNDQTRYHAAKDILDRAGFKPPDKYQEVQPEISQEDLIAQVIETLPRQLPDIWARMNVLQRKECLRGIGIDPGILDRKEGQVVSLAVIDGKQTG